ncbi:MAG: hypothetical protein JNJ99_04105, partial [Crocinitomicaceae bacterium]|nr:hypothetical protein [Crocinitomicaceae bacterium]
MISRIPEIFTRNFEDWFKIELFRRVIYIFLLLNTLTLLPIADDIFSYQGMAGTRWDYSMPIWAQPGYAFINVLSHPANSTYSSLYLVFIAGQLLFLITGIFRILPKISAFMVYFLSTNLFMKGSLMFTGAEVILSLILFYLMFIQSSDNTNKWKPKFRIRKDDPVYFTDVQNAVNNTFYYIILIQICILYFFSTFYKLLDENWTSGMAVAYIARNPAYSNGIMNFIFADNTILAVLATYSVLLYQGLFSVLVWFRKIKIPFLLFGVLFHLSIAFGMGVFTFGIVMCLIYIPFLSEEQVVKLGKKLR